MWIICTIFYHRLPGYTVYVVNQIFLGVKVPHRVGSVEDTRVHGSHLICLALLFEKSVSNMQLSLHNHQYELLDTVLIGKNKIPKINLHEHLID